MTSRKVSEKRRGLDFWEKPNAIAIYSTIVFLMVILVASAYHPSSGASGWTLSLEAGQITIILVIAALLLFRYYKSIKIGAGLLELTNLKNTVDSTVKDISDAKTEINKTKSGLESTIHSIEGLETDVQSLLPDVTDMVKIAPSSPEAESKMMGIMASLTTVQNRNRNEISSIRSSLHDKITALSTITEKLTASEEELRAQRNRIADLLREAENE